jgi:hypothetical protein
LKVGLDDQGIGVQFLAGPRDFPFLHNIKMNSRDHPASYTLGTGSMKLIHSSPCSVEAKNDGAVSPFHYMSSWHGAQLIKPMNNFLFHLIL